MNSGAVGLREPMPLRIAQGPTLKATGKTSEANSWKWKRETFQSKTASAILLSRRSWRKRIAGTVVNAMISRRLPRRCNCTREIKSWSWLSNGSVETAKYVHLSGSLSKVLIWDRTSYVSD